MHFAVGLILSAVIVYLLTVLYMKTRRPSFFPPGPPTLPFLGNLTLDMRDLPRVCREYRGRYGDIFSLILGKQTMVVVCGAEKINEILVKHGDVTSDRPDIFAFREFSKNQGVTASSGMTWRETRTCVASAFRSHGVGRQTTEHKVTQEIERFLDAVHKTGGRSFDAAELLRVSVANVICSICFGQRFDHNDADFIKLTDLLAEATGASPLTALLLVFPFLKYLPFDLIGNKKFLTKIQRLEAHCSKLLDSHRKSNDPNNVRDLVNEILHKQQIDHSRKTDSIFTDEMILRTVIDLLSAGTATTATSIRWFILFMIKYPDVQQRMRQEIRQNVGSERLVAMDDRAKLPFCEVVMHESLRMANVAVFALPHLCSQDLQMDEFIIPEGAIIMPFLSSVHEDPRHFERPQEFNPSRYLDENGTLVKTKLMVPFSTGRRACVGETLARMELFLFSTNLLQSYKLLPETDDTVPSLESEIGITHAPKHFLFRAVKLES